MLFTGGRGPVPQAGRAVWRAEQTAAAAREGDSSANTQPPPLESGLTVPTPILPEKWRSKAASSFLATWMFPCPNPSRSRSGPLLLGVLLGFGSTSPACPCRRTHLAFSGLHPTVPPWGLAPQSAYLQGLAWLRSGSRGLRAALVPDSARCRRGHVVHLQ